jgi:hypothetical protein
MLILWSGECFFVTRQGVPHHCIFLYDLREGKHSRSFAFFSHPEFVSHVLVCITDVGQHSVCFYR